MSPARDRRLYTGAGATRLLLLTIVTLGVVLRIYPWLLPHTFGGMMEYDDGVYYAAASSFLHGMVPYRDFSFLQPPLAALAWTPFAAVGELAGDPVGMAAARTAVVIASIVNILLVRRLVLGNGIPSRAREVGGLTAAALYALYVNSVAAEHTILLEPLTNLLSLLGCKVLFLSRGPSARRLLVAGAGFALATSVKVFGAAYLLAALAYLLTTKRGRAARQLTLGFAAALLVVWGPFLAAAPGAFVRDVVVTQLVRPPSGGRTALARLAELLGLHAALGSLATPLLVLFASAAVSTVCWYVYRSVHLSRYWVVLAAITIAAFLSSSSFFGHYGDALAAPGAIVTGYATQSWLESRFRRGRLALPLRAAATGTAAVIVLGTLRTLSAWSGQGDVAAAVRREVPSHSCVYTDSVSLLIAAGRLRVPAPSCPYWLDGRGEALVMTKNPPRDFYPGGFVTLGRWQAETSRQICHADFLLVRGDPRRTPEWSSLNRTYVAEHFRPRQAWSGMWPWQLWQRNVPQPPPGCTNHNRLWASLGQ